MSTTYGLTTIGLIIKTLEIIRGEIETLVQGSFGPAMLLGDQTILGQIIGIIAEREAALWDLLQQVYASQDPDSATGAALDALASLTGTLRPPASFSAVVLTLAGTPSTVVAAGNGASIGGIVKFVTTASATIATAASWATSTSYALGAVVTSGGNVYLCTAAGASTTAPTSTDNTISVLDGAGPLAWRFIGSGTGSVVVSAIAAVTGPVEGLAGTITTIDTPTAGWNGVVNANDAAPGRAVATDEELRTLRQLELASVGTSPQDAIRAALLQVSGVLAATVFVNNTDTTNSDTVPPHAIEALVQQTDPLFGADQAIRDCLLANVAAGIATYSGASGTSHVTGTSLDSQGVAHEIDFSRPQPISIYVVASITKDPLAYPADGDTEVLNAILAYGNAQTTGKDVVRSAVAAQAFQVPGVLDVPELLIYTDVISGLTDWVASTAYSATVGARSVIITVDGRKYICSQAGTSASSGNGPTGTGTFIADGTVRWDYLGATIPVTLRQLAVYQSSQISVTSTSGTP